MDSSRDAMHLNYDDTTSASDNETPQRVDRDFHHPYEPYPIQLDFMHAVYDCIEQGDVAILESPTGTVGLPYPPNPPLLTSKGKSLSLLCGALTWIRDHKNYVAKMEIEVTRGADDDDPEWMIEAARKSIRAKLVQRHADMEAKLAKIRADEDQARKRYESGESSGKRQKTSADTEARADEDFFLLDDYDSDDEASKTKPTDGNGLSAKTRALLQQLDPASYTDDDIDSTDEPKIFFCSRTHSQLTQFVNELRRTDFATSQPATSATGSGPHSLDIEIDRLSKQAVKHLSLGSRKNLCINNKVSRLSSTTAINERCLELQQPSTPADAKCSFLPNKDTKVLVNDFRDHAHAKVRDIEDLGKIGKQIGICPYYASRAAIKPSELITLPYPLLLQRTAREALGISLKGHVIIIDEAHNLMDSITGMHSMSVTLDQLRCARSQLMAYLEKFKNKLMGKNRVYVAQVVRVLDSLTSVLTKVALTKNMEGQTDANHLLSAKGADQINLYKLVQYLRESKLARKVDGYHEFQIEPKVRGKGLKDSRDSPVLTLIQDFLIVLMHPDPQGRYIWSKLPLCDDGSPNVQLKYILLDPKDLFKDIVDDARAVILAGGTMSPMSDYYNHLFPYRATKDIRTLSCDHVIDPKNLLPMTLMHGCWGTRFRLTIDTRKNHSLITELGETILEIARVVPDGLVVFFPSHAFLEKARTVWQTEDEGSSTWSQLQTMKPTFHEPSSKVPASTNHERAARSLQVDQVLAEYSNSIHDPANSKGALLFAVVGGSLSEGINFSDKLGRAVVVVGLPFPSSASKEWTVKQGYVWQQTLGPPPVKKAAAQDLLLNACMRAVNQTIGRAIRHKNDYAAVILLDSRYEEDHFAKRLPGWIRRSKKPATNDFDKDMMMLKDFYAMHQK